MNKHLEINKLYEELVQKNEIWSESKIKEYYTNFQERFSIERLKSLSGEEVLNTIFEMSNRGSLVYWLEFKNDDEYEQVIFGSIAGGSSYKYGLFNKSNVGWIYGTSSKNARQIAKEEAIEIAVKKRDLLVKGAELISALKDDSDEVYNELQRNLEENISDILNQAWVHKYYHMIFPNKIDTFHKCEFHKYYMGKFLEENEHAKVEEKIYSMAAPIIRFAKKTNLSVANCLQLGYRLFGGIQNYWEIDEEQIGAAKEVFLSQGIFGIKEINQDLNNFTEGKFSAFKTQVEAVDSAMTTLRVRDIYEIKYSTKVNDAIVLCKDNIPTYIGRIIGEYEYDGEQAINHRRRVEWIRVENTSKKIISKNTSRFISEIVELQSIIHVEKLKAGNTNLIEPVKPVTKVKKIDELTTIQKKIKSILERKGQVILYGPPGTGKSYWGEGTCRELAAVKQFGKSFIYLDENEMEEVEGEADRLGTVSMCCFHPTYGYEDFIEGIKPKVVDGKTVFELRDGIFKRVCKVAVKDRSKDYYLIIDEINRGDISRIFGELITVLEKSKREKEIILPLSGERFKVPKNLFIVGTMNTTDKSIAYLDIALRRRFGFVEIMPDVDLLTSANVEGLNLGLWLKEINTNIRKYLGREGRNMQIGHSYLLEGDKPIRDIEALACVVREDIVPLVEEYCYGDYSSLENILGTGLVNKKNQEFDMDVLELKVDKADYISALKAVNPEVFIVDSDIDEEEDGDE